MADNKINSGLLEFSEDQKVFVALDAETSEVKKAVTIDGDGVETDIAGGGGGDVTVEALNVTENGTYSEEGKAYSPVTVEVAGGLLSTANVIVHYSQDSQGIPVNFDSMVTIDIYKSTGLTAATLNYGDSYIPTTELGTINNIKVPLYDNSNYYTRMNLSLLDGEGAVLLPDVYHVDSGDAVIEDNNLQIKGDCEITITLVYSD